MAEANLDLQPLWPSYQSYEQVYCLHISGEVCVQFQEKQLYAWCNLICCRFDKVCTQFEEKPAVHLPR